MNDSLFPREIVNWINGQETPVLSGQWFEKISPHDGTFLCHAARSAAEDVAAAVKSAKSAQTGWDNCTPVKRGEILHAFATGLLEHREIIAQVVSLETGKSHKDALEETDGAISMALFYAGEGQRLDGKTTASTIPHTWTMTIRQPVGLAGILVSAATPFATIISNIFPACICGNAAVVKASEDAPMTAWITGWVANETGLPAGVLNIVQGYGKEAGASLVAHKDIGVISFTGCSSVGREIGQTAGGRLAKFSLALGGKNPCVICEDADLENAARRVLHSCFSNAGQHRLASSRILVFDAVYEKFRSLLLLKTEKLRVGHEDSDDLGAIINEKRLDHLLSLVKRARDAGAAVLTGGNRLSGPNHKNGFYMAPVFIEDGNPQAEISTAEFSGPIACLYRVKNFGDALDLANHSPAGPVACIHTQNIGRALEFSRKAHAGSVIVNAGTYTAESRFSIGGLKQAAPDNRVSGAGVLDIYSELKEVCLITNP